MSSSTNKRIAKNTLFLYFRQILILTVTLYTSRIVLNALGIENYGVYNVVGGMVAMFGFLNGALAQATQRYIAFGLDRDTVSKQRNTFSMLMNVHILIALILFILCETIGLWLFYNKLVIPQESLSSAFWVMQFSIVSMIITITQVPYNASIFGHERMNAYAYISIVEVFLKLGTVLSLKFLFTDKLLAYGCLTMLVSFFVAMTYRVYCLKTFENCHYRLYWSRTLFGEIIRYTGWSVIGNLAWTLNGQGMNFLINIFFGPVYNAARGVAANVEAAVSSFLTNFLGPTIPPIIKSYAAGDMQGMLNLCHKSSKFGFLLFMCLSLPLISVINQVLNIWLITPPPMAGLLCVLSLIYIQCNSMGGTLQNVVQATGNVKTFQIANGSLRLFALPLVYVLYRFSFPIVTYLWVLIVVSLLGLIVQLLIVRRLVSQFAITDFLQRVTLYELAAYAIPLSVSVWCSRQLFTFTTSVCVFLCVLFLCVSSVWIIGFTKHERQWILGIIKNKISKRTNTKDLHDE